MANALAVTLHASGEETASGTGPVVDIGAGRSALALSLSITSTDGALATHIETSANGATGWHEIGQFDSSNAPFQSERSFDQAERYVRARWTFDGTAVTFELAGAAHQLFATRRHLFRRMPEEALTSRAQTHEIADALIAASGDTEDAIGTAYSMPLVRGSESVARRSASIALYLLMDGVVGVKPGGVAVLYVNGYDTEHRTMSDV